MVVLSPCKIRHRAMVCGINLKCRFSLRGRNWPIRASNAPKSPKKRCVRCLVVEKISFACLVCGSSALVALRLNMRQSTESFQSLAHCT